MYTFDSTKVMDETLIKKMSKDIQSYLEDKKLSGVKAKDLMPMLIERGYFKKDHRNGLPLRDVLRDLDRTNRLHLLPQVQAERKDVNIYWYFNPVLDDFSLKILKYLEQNQIRLNRFNSWNHCYKAFGMLGDSNILSLHLGFYLASWGLYRGSGKLLQNDYLVHEGAVEIVNEFKYLRCSHEREVDRNDIEGIIALVTKLKAHYFALGIQPTNTLISKVVLGTLGCLPAIDRYFCDGVLNDKLTFRSLTTQSLTNLMCYVEEKKKELKQIQRQYSEFYYPNMKLIDMYFWHIGFENEKKASILMNSLKSN